jgi:hypothetical protein
MTDLGMRVSLWDSKVVTGRFEESGAFWTAGGGFRRDGSAFGAEMELYREAPALGAAFGLLDHQRAAVFAGGFDLSFFAPGFHSGVTAAA